MFRSGFARCPLDGVPLQELVGDPLAGSMFADRYVIEECIGEGGMGRVYRARHQRVSRRFAVKVLYGDHATDPKMRDRFAREAEAASRLDHPNVVSVLDFGETKEGLLYLVMDFVEGREVAGAIDDEAPFPAHRVERILRQLCHGLEHAHAKGLVHRDFKGENVLLTGGGDDEVARIVDFGIAYLLEAADVQRLTTEGMVLGTPAYMSPEQATGAELDHRTDLFSLGVLVYEMLAGTLPFEGPPLAIARQNLAVDPPPIRERVPGLEVSEHLEAIAMKLMAKKPEDRFQSAREVIDALDEATPALAAAPPIDPAAYRPTAPAELATPPKSKLPWIAALVAVLMIGAVTLTVLSTRGKRRARAAAPLDAAPPAMSSDAAIVAAEPTADAATPPGEQAARTPDAAAPPGEHAAPKPARAPKRSEKEPARRKRSGVASKVRAAEPKRALVITRADLQRRYIAVGEAIERLSKRRGDAVAAPFRSKYFKIPFSTAVRTPSLRREVDRQLRRLHRQVSRAMKTGG